ncbi:17525_t:CDS:2, partial [Racocetra persica]
YMAQNTKARYLHPVVPSNNARQQLTSQLAATTANDTPLDEQAATILK